MVPAVTLVTAIALPLAFGLCAVLLGLPRSRACPHCRAPTHRVRWWPLALARRLVRGAGRLQRRGCPACGWQGLARLPRPIADDAGPARRGGVRTRAETERRGTRPQGLEVRRIDVDGSVWRVLLQGWMEGDRWVGRLLFVEPGGRVWRERNALEYASVEALLGRVLTLPDDALAGRLRRAIR